MVRLAHSAAVGIIRSAHGNRQRTGLGGGDGVLAGGGRGGLCGGDCTGEDQGDDSCANDVLHWNTPNLCVSSEISAVYCDGAFSAFRSRWDHQERTWESAAHWSWRQ